MHLEFKDQEIDQLQSDLTSLRSDLKQSTTLTRSALFPMSFIVVMENGGEVTSFGSTKVSQWYDDFVRAERSIIAKMGRQGDPVDHVKQLSEDASLSVDFFTTDVDDVDNKQLNAEFNNIVHTIGNHGDMGHIRSALGKYADAQGTDEAGIRHVMYRGRRREYAIRLIYRKSPSKKVALDNFTY